MVIKTKHGTRVRIIRDLPPFRCNGQEVEQVEIENIDPKSVTCGMVTMVNRDELVEGER